MTQEVNAAIEGAVEAGADAIVVKDAHGGGTNINLEELHPAAELFSGWGPLNSMVEGIDDSFDALMLIGYHARGETMGGTLAHSWSSNVLDLQINCKAMGEAGWATATAGHFGVPLALVTGDDKLLAQARDELPAGYRTVTTKTGHAHKAAQCRPIPTVRAEIREAAAACLSDLDALGVFKPEMPMELTIRFRHWEGLHACAAVPGVEQLDATTFRARAKDFLEAHRYFITLHRLARP
jgi:D-amino peptidase